MGRFCVQCQAPLHKPKPGSRYCSTDCYFIFQTPYRPPNACWEWQGVKEPFGYGRMVPGRGKRKAAHHFSYERSKGKIPKGKIILHTCDNPSCVNPQHLVAGTCLDNVLDMVKKGRHGADYNNGTDNHAAVLTERQVLEIRKSKLSRVQAAKKYGVSPSAIKKIRTRKTWTHI